MEETLPRVPLPEEEELIAAEGRLSSGRARLRRLVPWALLVLALAASWSGWRWLSRTGEAPITFRTARIQRGDVAQTVSATGPLSAVSTVDVGSQVSGNIAKLYADFNDPVKAGQLLAEIEPSTFEARLVQAEADYRNAGATLELKRLNLQRTQDLFARQFVAQSDLDQAVAELHQQEAMVDIKAAAVKSARVDLDRTRIRSPIDGVVIDRAIDVGQTVQASFAAPKLFKLAQDLREMQITANVSEADIGGVQPGQDVEFTVDAFPGQIFRGKVQEVRNNTTITNNVVTYPTMVTLANPDLRLRPGMTANLTITLARRSGVLRVANAALRYSPPAEMLAAEPETPRNPLERILYVAGGEVDAGGRFSGLLEPTVVRIGLSDAVYTEIVSGVAEGTAVATGVSTVPVASSGGGTVNPFVPKMPPHGPRR